MEITIDQNTITVSGTFKTINDADKLIKAIQSIPSNSIHLKITEANLLPSSVISALLKIKEEGKELHLQVNEILYELLTNLGFEERFKIEAV
ncbi:MAG: hypothetical protein GXO62_04925 [Epsilonproteobacteria bacterium]|nr:hypothetical protein [Campylobacterota bacterium]